MGLYTRRKSLWQRRQEGLPPTTIGPEDPSDFIVQTPVVEEKLVEQPPFKIDMGVGKIVKEKTKHEKK